MRAGMLSVIALAVGMQLPASLVDYRLTMPNIRKMAAAYGRIDAALVAKPALATSLTKAKGATSPEELMARFDNDPIIRKAIAWAGLSTRDFVLTHLATVTTGMTATAVQGGAKPPTAPAAVANLKLYKQNRAEIDRLMSELKKSPSLLAIGTESVDDDDDE